MGKDKEKKVKSYKGKVKSYKEKVKSKKEKINKETIRMMGMMWKEMPLLATNLSERIARQ